MSLIIVKDIYRADGQTAEAELYHNKVSGKLDFLQYFQTSGYSNLIFKDENEILDFLDKYYPDKANMITVIESNYFASLHYPEKVGDRHLKFFAYIKEV